MMRSGRGVYGLIGLLLAGALGINGCSRDEADVESVVEAPPYVILIVMDTMRADHLGCYGYDRPTSPRIDGFAGSATVFTRAIATSPWTNPTHASLFTGKDPFEHGAHRLEKRWGKPGINANPLSGRHMRLAEMFLREGYATGAFIANEAHVNKRWRLITGFETSHVEWGRSGIINQHVYTWLDTLSTDRFFLFINYMDTHVPYNTSVPWEHLDKQVPGDRGEMLKALAGRVLLQEQDPPPTLVRRLNDQYDTAVFNLDIQIGELFDYLEEKGLYDRALIILTSDHGELFGEHRLAGHGLDVYHKLVWAPLIIKEPDQRDSRSDETVVTSSDMPRMILSYFPRETRQRYRSDFPNAPGNHPAITQNYWPKPPELSGPPITRRFRRVRTAYYDWPYKYIHSSDEAFELYHMEDDPEESHNLIEERREIAEQMRERLLLYQKSRRRADRTIKQSPLTEEEIKILKSLGYL